MVLDSVFPVRRTAAWRLLCHDVVVNQMALGSYRAGLLRALEGTDCDIVFLVGDEHFGEGVVTDVSSRLVRRTGRNVFVLGRRVGWQRGCLVRGLLARTLVVELNPRNMTTWLLLATRWATRRRTAGWGHAHSRRGADPEHNRVRRVMQAMCSDLIAYTETEAHELEDLFPGKSVLPARNALYSVEELAGLTPEPAGDRRDLIMIGRLIPEKRSLLGVQAFHRAVDAIPADAMLHVVGAGPQEREVAEYVATNNLGERVRLHGYVTGLDRLAPLFGRCCALLAPGYIGLNATQALGFGLPVLYSRDEPHSPEIEALGASNSVAFDTDDVDACARAVAEFYQGRWSFDSSRIAASARTAYSTDRMIIPFVRLGALMKEPTSAPDRPIAQRLVPLRALVRRLRLLRVNALSGGKMEVGHNFAIGGGGQILCPNFFRAGADVHVGRDFLCEVDVTIGSGVLVSSRVCLIGDDHEIPPAGTSLYTAGRKPSQHVHLEGDNLIGNGTIILGNVTIGYGAVVGAGSLVLKDVPPNTVYAGRPARFIRSREAPAGQVPAERIAR